MASKTPIELIDSLTETELQVMELYCANKEQKEIAKILHIGYGTVRTHLSNIREKLEVDKSWKIRNQFCQYLVGNVGVKSQAVKPDEKLTPDIPSYPDQKTSEPKEIQDSGITSDNSKKQGIRKNIVIFVGLIIILCIFSTGWIWKYILKPYIVRETPTPEIIIEKVTQEVTVIVTNTPGPPRPSDTPKVLVVTATPTPGPSYTPTHTPTPTQTPSQTPTPTYTSTPTPTIPPFAVGDEWSDERVTLRVVSRTFNTNWGVGLVGYHFATGFHLEYENYSSDTIVLRYNSETFTLKDNRGRYYPCTYRNGSLHYTTDPISVSVENADVYEFIVGCGRDMEFGMDVTYVVLSIRDFSSLGTSDWLIEVPR